MSNWVWQPVGEMATPTLTRNLGPLFTAIQARRGRSGMRASGVTTFHQRGMVNRRYVEQEIEEEEEKGGEGSGNSSANDEDWPMITWEEKE